MNNLFDLNYLNLISTRHSELYDMFLRYKTIDHLCPVSRVLSNILDMMIFVFFQRYEHS